MRAWNDWHLDEWDGAAPRSLHPGAAPVAATTRELAADEVRAQRRAGLQGRELPREPASTSGSRRCTPTTGTRSSRACEETGTVVCLHNASSGWSASRSPGAPLELLTTLFPVNALVTAADWLWSGVPTRFPEPADLPRRERHRLGADAPQPHRLRDGPLGDRARGLARPDAAPDARCCGATSGSR